MDRRGFLIGISTAALTTALPSSMGACIEVEADIVIPPFLTTMIDPKIFKILFAPNRAVFIDSEE